MSKNTKVDGRLNREKWLEKSLSVLADAGNEMLTIEVLCERLGMSRGSFYWHFNDRDDFLIAIIECWEQQSTTALRDYMLSLDCGPEKRLQNLLEKILTFRFSKLELPMRLWAMKNPKTKEVLQRIDRTRYEGVRSLFTDMGFTGDELEMRTQTCVIYYNFMDGFSIEMSDDKEAVRRQNLLRHVLLTTPTPSSE
jgi:AcrR family transcriptional regulator